jgi:peptide/nickel transport system substrate-binding protein
MPDATGAGEREPLGSIVILSDTDRDGVMDRREVFADGLVLPRSVHPCEGGALVVIPPQLVFLRDDDGDGRVDTRELLDPKVREALAHGVNREAIIETVLNGYGKPAATMFTSLSGQWQNTDIQPEAYDLDLGNQILDELGYTKGSDGIRVKPDGSTMAYEVITPDTVDGLDRLFEIVAADWEKLGVKITQKKMDGTAAFEAIGAPEWKYEEFDIMMWNWVGYIDPDFMLSVITCDQWGGWSDTGYCNPAYDELYKQQAVTVDPEERRKIVWEMQEILYRDRPYIFIAQGQFVRAYRGNWGGIMDPYLLYVSKIPWDTLHRTAD